MTDDRITEAAELLLYDHHTKVEIEDRTILLVDPVKGDPGLSVLRVLGLAQAASPVGAAAHGPNGVAVGVWKTPELYLARWTKGKRWVVGYRLTGGSRLSDYVGIEGRVPTRLETGHWYNSLPDAVSELFLEAGLLIDEPPFPVVVPTPTPPPSTAASRSATTATRSVATSPTAPKPRTQAARPSTRAKPVSTTRLCPGCRMHKAIGQFVAGSDRCVDCRMA